jgi:hypothetical protein
MIPTGLGRSCAANAAVNRDRLDKAQLIEHLEVAV